MTEILPPSLTDIGVRVGTPQDVHDIMELALSASTENGFTRANPAKMLNEIYASLALNRGVMGIIGEPGQPAEGAVLLRIGEMWYSTDPVVEEKAIFIRPEFRTDTGDRSSNRMGRHRRLCTFSKRVANGLGIPLIIGVLSHNRTEGKIRLYEREFGPCAGAFFLYGAETGKAN